MINKFFKKMQLFFILSRTKHGILDVATPAFCAILWLGGFPELKIIVLGLITAFAAYTSIYALNDLLGCRVDREKIINSKEEKYSGYAVESSQDRHPVAQNLLTFKEGMLWAVFWGLLAVIGSYILSKIAFLIFLSGAVLEIIYCLLLKITSFRTLVSGVVKTCGPLAAIVTVDSRPSLIPLLIVFSILFFWEVGGQNIPADWNDMKEDIKVHCKTIPILFSKRGSSLIILFSLLLAVFFSSFLGIIFNYKFGVLFSCLCVVLGFIFLIFPSLRLKNSLDSRDASRLFSFASFYPLALLSLTTFWIVFIKGV